MLASSIATINVVGIGLSGLLDPVGALLLFYLRFSFQGGVLSHSDCQLQGEL